MPEIRRMNDGDLAQVNSVFTKAFSNARIDEGLKQHRVSPCRIAFLKMYLDRSGAGALVADERGQVVGFNFNHLYGSTGWMGPLAVLPKYQGLGVGKAVVCAGIDYLKERKATIIGLETMPRNFRNIGFYGKLGFDPGPLCLDMVAKAHDGASPVDTRRARILYLKDCASADRETMIQGCAEISNALSPGLDYSGEILLNMEHRYGDTVVLVDEAGVAGFAVCHLEPYGQFEERRELKVNVLAMRPEPVAIHTCPTEGTAPSPPVPESSARGQEPAAARTAPVTVGTEPGGGRARRGPALSEEGPPSRAALDRLSALLAGVKDLAARESLSVVRLHVRSDKWIALRSLLSWGYSVGYSDLRMCLSGFAEEEPSEWLHFCRWQ